MKNPLSMIGVCAVCLFATPLFAAPVDDVTTILRGFLAEPNYSWATITTRGMPEEGGSMVGEDVEGQHEKSGYTKIAFKTGPHFFGDSHPSGTRLGITDQSTFWSSHWVYEMPEGWTRLADLKLPSAARPPVAPPTRPGGIRIGGASTGITVGGTIYRAAGAWRPDLEIEIIVENVAGVEKIRNGVFEIELTSTGAGLLALVPTPPISLWPFHTENGSGSVTIQIREGALASYEFKVEADLVGLGHRNHRAVSRRRNLTDIGTTIIDVPPEVEKALGHK